MIGGPVQIGVTDPGVEDLDLHVVRARFASLKFPRRQRGTWLLDCVTVGCDHHKLLACPSSTADGFDSHYEVAANGAVAASARWLAQRPA